ncbi:hypothetical protein [Nocardia thraciensis]
MHAALGRIFHRIDELVGRGTRALSDELTRTGRGLRAAVDNKASADQVAGRTISRVNTHPGGPSAPPPSGMLRGRDSSGNDHDFSARDVKNVPLRDSRGRAIGVSFPTKDADGPTEPGDIETLRRFAGARYRSSDEILFPMHRTERTEPWIVGESGPAPWFDSGNPTRVPVYVHAHGSVDSVSIKINTGSRLRPRWIEVQVDGRTFGNVLLANRHFHRAAQANPESPLVMLTCDGALPGPGDNRSQLEQIAEPLHQAGMQRDVYGTVGSNAVETLDDMSYLAVEEFRDAAGNRLPVPPLTVIRPPPTT